METTSQKEGCDVKGSSEHLQHPKENLVHTNMMQYALWQLHV